MKSSKNDLASSPFWALRSLRATFTVRDVISVNHMKTFSMKKAVVKAYLGRWPFCTRYRRAAMKKRVCRHHIHLLVVAWIQDGQVQVWHQLQFVLAVNFAVPNLSERDLEKQNNAMF